MAEFVDYLNAEIQALERSLEGDLRYRKLRELRRVWELYSAPVGAATADSPSLADVDTRRSRRRPPPREMTQATRIIVAAATEYLTGRTEIVPLRTIHHHIADERGINIGGKDPINSLSAILSRYGFESHGRSGWRLRQAASGEPGDDVPHHPGSDMTDESELFSAPKANGAATEIHGAATF